MDYISRFRDKVNHDTIMKGNFDYDDDYFY